ncbi:hypothetical protein GGF46_001870 [Coemansia sp. RSA 552]|nr:hypothetical protein GGF46_001870 [Coemansia sp. RSA 552]
MSASRRLSYAEGGAARARSGSLAGPGVGQAVEVQGNRGIIRFSGTTDFATGRWFGVELEQAQGKNDGCVQGKRYFECPPNHGVFVRSSQVKMLTAATRTETPARGSARSTIHGAEIQRPGEPRLRTPSASPGGGIPSGMDALRAARRASALPGRASGQASAIAPPPAPSSGSRLSGALAQRASQLPGAASGAGSQRRLSSAQGLGGRQSTLSGARSPASASGTRSGSRQALAGDSEESSRPDSREQPPAHMRAEAPSPSVDVAGPAGGEPQAPSTPTKVPVAAGTEDAGAADPDEAPRTPYRPALSMDASSTFDAQSPAPAMAAQTVPMKQYEELRLKFKFMEQKRSEDRQRLQEAETVRAEAVQAVQVRDKLAAKVGAQQTELRTLRQRLKSASTEREDVEAKYTETLDSMEMLAVDKEMAEERAETLAQEMNALREQLDEARTDLDVLRSGGDHSAVLPGEDGEATALGYTQLQKQNERLKEALMRLRDVSVDNESQLSQKVKQLEREAQLTQELADESSDLKEKLATVELQVEDLKERLDDALGAEEMIESLTERNLDLNARVEELQSVVENLEALCEVNNEMEETRAEEEQGLRAEIERLGAVIGDKTRRIDKLEEALADFQFNVKQYRELVATLQADLQRLREREQSQASEVATISSKTQEMMSLNLQLRSTMTKTKARAIDLELRRLEADQATARLDMTEPFLPDHFFRSESEALQAVLAFKRLAVKSDILCKQLEQDEAVDVGVSDDFVAAADIRLLLTQFSGSAALLAAFLSTCGDSEFMRLGSLLPDAQAMERRLNGLVDLVRNEEFRPSDSLPEIRRLAAQLAALADSHVPPMLQATAPLRLDAIVGHLAFASDVQLSNLFYVEQLLVAGQPGGTNGSDEATGSVFSAQDRQQIDLEMLPAVASVIQNCKAAKQAAIKLLRRSTELRRADLGANSGVFEQAGQLQQTSNELSEYAVRARTAIQDALSTARSADEDSSVGVERLRQDLNNIAQDVFGAADAAALGLALGVSQRLTKDLSALLAVLGSEESTTKVDTVSVAPWTRRAQQFKASLIQNADVERRTEALNEEIISLARELKLRDQTIQEYSVKSEMLDKRTEAVKRQQEQISELRVLLDRSKAKVQTYEEAIESLQGEMDTLEAECRKLKQENAAAAKSAAASSDGHGQGATGYGTPMPTDLLGLRNKITALQSSVMYLRRENAYLRSKYMYADELQLLSQPLPHAQGLSAGTGEVVREAKLVAKEARRLAAMPRLVRLTAKDDGSRPGWQPLSSRPQFDFYRQQTLAQTLKQRMESVQDRLRCLPRYPILAMGSSIA